MPNIMVKFAEESSAQSYLAVCNAHNPWVGETWSYIRVDANGFFVVAYQGPPTVYDDVVVEEPDECRTLRFELGGVLIDRFDAPPEEE